MNKNVNATHIFSLTNTSAGVMTGLVNTTNYTRVNVTDIFDEPGFIVRNIHLLKAVVLCIVVIILIVTTCKFVLKTFSKYLEIDQKDDG